MSGYYKSESFNNNGTSRSQLDDPFQLVDDSESDTDLLNLESEKYSYLDSDMPFVPSSQKQNNRLFSFSDVDISAWIKKPFNDESLKHKKVTFLNTLTDLTSQPEAKTDSKLINQTVTKSTLKRMSPSNCKEDLLESHRTAEDEVETYTEKKTFICEANDKKETRRHWDEPRVLFPKEVNVSRDDTFSPDYRPASHSFRDEIDRLINKNQELNFNDILDSVNLDSQMDKHEGFNGQTQNYINTNTITKSKIGKTATISKYDVTDSPSNLMSSKAYNFEHRSSEDNYFDEDFLNPEEYETLNHQITSTPIQPSLSTVRTITPTKSYPDPPKFTFNTSNWRNYTVNGMHDCRTCCNGTPKKANTDQKAPSSTRSSYLLDPFLRSPSRPRSLNQNNNNYKASTESNRTFSLKPSPEQSTARKAILAPQVNGSTYSKEPKNIRNPSITAKFNCENAKNHNTTGPCLNMSNYTNNTQVANKRVKGVNDSYFKESNGLDNCNVSPLKSMTNLQKANYIHNNGLPKLSDLQIIQNNSPKPTPKLSSNKTLPTKSLRSGIPVSGTRTGNLFQSRPRNLRLVGDSSWSKGFF